MKFIKTILKVLGSSPIQDIVILDMHSNNVVDENVWLFVCKKALRSN